VTPRTEPRRTSAALASLLALPLALAACKKGEPAGSDGGAPSGSAAAAAPSVTIPAGAFHAGVTCGALPRVTTEEVVGVEAALGEFSIDVLPYPNDPSRPARVGVSRDEAAGLCAQSGKRLCTELEWERACKGPGNTTFEYGAAYNPMNCKKSTDLLPDKRPKCVSGFGVKDTHGLVFEWTSSPWGRGTAGDLGTVRGGDGPGGILQARCANAQSRPPSTQSGDVGFRCCSGPRNTSEVVLSLDVKPPLVEEPALEPTLAAAMLSKMPVDHRAAKDAAVGFDTMWRWHPRANEELLVGLWSSKPSDKTKPASRELAVFHACSGIPTLIARMRGPVATLGAPVPGADPQKLTAPVTIAADKGDVKIEYIHGAAKLEQPPFVKVASALPSASASASPTDRPAIIIPKPKR
jgi:hypothetical protein